MSIYLINKNISYFLNTLLKKIVIYLIITFKWWCLLCFLVRFGAHFIHLMWKSDNRDQNYYLIFIVTDFRYWYDYYQVKESLAQAQINHRNIFLLEKKSDYQVNNHFLNDVLKKNQRFH